MMSDEIIKVLDNLGQRFGIAIDWTSENVIPYLQNLFDRYINYDIFINILEMSILLVLTIVFGILSYKWLKKWNKENEKQWLERNEKVLYILITFVSIFGILLLLDLILFPYGIDSLLKDIYIPEVRILELIKGSV